MKPNKEFLVLDLGVSPDSSLPESNFFELFYPYKHKIIAASIEDASFLEELYPGLKFCQIENNNKLPFKDDHFDAVFCSAVIEHVGTKSKQEFFIREILRISKSFFITTPNRWFPLEFHTFLPFLHWFPQKTHQLFLKKLGYSFWANTDNLNLLSEKTFLNLFPQCKSINIYKYRLFGLTSNLVIYGEK